MAALRQLATAMAGRVLLVDDGSSDGTGQVATDAADAVPAGARHPGARAQRGQGRSRAAGHADRPRRRGPADRVLRRRPGDAAGRDGAVGRGAAQGPGPGRRARLRAWRCSGIASSARGPATTSDGCLPPPAARSSACRCTTRSAGRRSSATRRRCGPRWPRRSPAGGRSTWSCSAAWATGADRRFLEVPLERWHDVGGSKLRPRDAVTAAVDLLRVRRALRHYPRRGAEATSPSFSWRCCLGNSIGDSKRATVKRVRRVSRSTKRSGRLLVGGEVDPLVGCELEQPPPGVDGGCVAARLEHDSSNGSRPAAAASRPASFSRSPSALAAAMTSARSSSSSTRSASSSPSAKAIGARPSGVIAAAAPSTWNTRTVSVPSAWRPRPIWRIVTSSATTTSTPLPASAASVGPLYGSAKRSTLVS